MKIRPDTLATIRSSFWLIGTGVKSLQGGSSSRKARSTSSAIVGFKRSGGAMLACGVAEGAELGRLTEGWSQILLHNMGDYRSVRARMCPFRVHLLSGCQIILAGHLPLASRGGQDYLVDSYGKTDMVVWEVL